MSRTQKGRPRCASGHKCDWCGPKVSADRRDARGPLLEQTCKACGDRESRCLCWHDSGIWDPWFMNANEMAWHEELDAQQEE